MSEYSTISDVVDAAERLVVCYTAERWATDDVQDRIRHLRSVLAGSEWRCPSCDRTGMQTFPGKDTLCACDGLGVEMERIP